MNRWISETERPKNCVFICPACKQRVHYMDGDCRKKHDGTAVARCKYYFCPWCGVRVNQEEA